MKYSFLLIGLFCHFNILNAQIHKLAVHQIVSTYQLDLIKDQLVQIDRQAKPAGSNKLLVVNGFLNKNELLLNYQLGDPGPEGFYTVYLDITLDGVSIQTHPGYLLGDLGQIKSFVVTEKRITWTNLIAQLPAAKGLLQLSLKVEWWGLQYLAYGVDCNQYPEFGFRQKLPYYLGFAGGAGSVITGVILQNNAQKHYERHREAKTLIERRGEYEMYTNKLHTAEVVSYIGVGIIVADVLLYFLRREKHKKRIRIFEEYCNTQQLSISPMWQPSTTEQTAQAGLQIFYQF